MRLQRRLLLTSLGSLGIAASATGWWWLHQRPHAALRASLLDGLVGRMMSQPAKPYTNPALGLNHLRKFRNAISFAGTESVRRNVANSQAWRFPPF